MLRRWRLQFDPPAPTDNGISVLSSPDREELDRLRREVKRLRREREILKNGSVDWETPFVMEATPVSRLS